MVKFLPHRRKNNSAHILDCKHVSGKPNKRYLVLVPNTQGILIFPPFSEFGGSSVFYGYNYLFSGIGETKSSGTNPQILLKGVLLVLQHAINR